MVVKRRQTATDRILCRRNDWYEVRKKADSTYFQASFTNQALEKEMGYPDEGRRVTGQKPNESKAVRLEGRE